MSVIPFRVVSLKQCLFCSVLFNFVAIYKFFDGFSDIFRRVQQLLKHSVKSMILVAKMQKKAYNLIYG